MAKCNVMLEQRNAGRYAEKFPERWYPFHTTFTAVHQRLREIESVVPKNNDTGRPATVTADNDELILMAIKDNPTIISRRMQCISMSRNRLPLNIRQNVDQKFSSMLKYWCEYVLGDTCLHCHLDYFSQQLASKSDKQVA